MLICAKSEFLNGSFDEPEEESFQKLAFLEVVNDSWNFLKIFCLTVLSTSCSFSSPIIFCQTFNGNCPNWSCWFWFLNSSIICSLQFLEVSEESSVNFAGKNIGRPSSAFLTSFAK
ncbi:hypothetical protein [Mesomycoplasma dispar]|uniref:hypothetical protein n=1 Tax=Mesomycoplasma dispar TaxID=86660 RepID=UPI0005DA1180|nr:hypothetical protein [Mesomycoplasma dispar]AJR12576.1 hypothetical protein MDIS_02730 [Mesomycoplasma dispar]